MFPRLLRLLWGELTDTEIKTFGFLSVILFFIIGSYWIFLSLKDSLLKGTIGFDMQPTAKVTSLVVIMATLFVYSKLVDCVKKTTLFFIILGTYAAIFFVLAYFAAHPDIGLGNTLISSSRKFGWVSYFVFESFGSLVVPLFWGFVTSFTTTDAAQRGFPFIIAGGQIGAIVGPTMVTHAEVIGIPTLLFIGACGVSIVPFLIYLFITRLKPTTTTQTITHHVGSSWGEGLKLVLTRPYLMGILGMVMLHQCIGTILAFQMKRMADVQFTSTAGFAAFAGEYGQITNIIALVFTLFGTSFALRRLGLAACLVLYPIVIAFVVGSLIFTAHLPVIYWGMVLLKGLGYALNNPAREIVYIPTSNAVKYKAKSWIDGFGNRSAKAIGAASIIGLQQINHSVSFLMSSSAILSLALVGCWIGIAAYIGRSFNYLVDNKKILE